MRATQEFHARQVTSSETLIATNSHLWLRVSSRCSSNILVRQASTRPDLPKTMALRLCQAWMAWMALTAVQAQYHYQVHVKAFTDANCAEPNGYETISDVDVCEIRERDGEDTVWTMTALSSDLTEVYSLRYDNQECSGVPIQNDSYVVACHSTGGGLYQTREIISYSTTTQTQTTVTSTTEPATSAASGKLHHWFPPPGQRSDTETYQLYTYHFDANSFPNCTEGQHTQLYIFDPEMGVCRDYQWNGAQVWHKKLVTDDLTEAIIMIYNDPECSGTLLDSETWTMGCTEEGSSSWLLLIVDSGSASTSTTTTAASTSSAGTTSAVTDYHGHRWVPPAGQRSEGHTYQLYNFHFDANFFPNCTEGQHTYSGLMDPAMGACWDYQWNGAKVWHKKEVSDDLTSAIIKIYNDSACSGTLLDSETWLMGCYQEGPNSWLRQIVVSTSTTTTSAVTDYHGHRWVPPAGQRSEGHTYQLYNFHFDANFFPNCTEGQHTYSGLMDPAMGACWDYQWNGAKVWHKKEVSDDLTSAIIKIYNDSACSGTLLDSETWLMGCYQEGPNSWLRQIVVSTSTTTTSAVTDYHGHRWVPPAGQRSEGHTYQLYNFHFDANFFPNCTEGQHTYSGLMDPAMGACWDYQWNGAKVWHRKEVSDDLTSAIIKIYNDSACSGTLLDSETWLMGCYQEGPNSWLRQIVVSTSTTTTSALTDYYGLRWVPPARQRSDNHTYQLYSFYFDANYFPNCTEGQHTYANLMDPNMGACSPYQWEGAQVWNTKEVSEDLTSAIVRIYGDSECSGTLLHNETWQMGCWQSGPSSFLTAIIDASTTPITSTTTSQDSSKTPEALKKKASPGFGDPKVPLGAPSFPCKRSPRASPPPPSQAASAKRPPPNSLEPYLIARCLFKVLFGLSQMPAVLKPCRNPQRPSDGKQEVGEVDEARGGFKDCRVEARLNKSLGVASALRLLGLRGKLPYSALGLRALDGFGAVEASAEGPEFF